jgi:hypothetical protein
VVPLITLDLDDADLPDADLPDAVEVQDDGRVVAVNRDFDALQEAIVRADFRTFSGERDLFFFSTNPRRWFFAEAKWKDKMIPSEYEWFDIALKTLGEKGRVRVYRVVPSRRCRRQQPMLDSRPRTCLKPKPPRHRPRPTLSEASRARRPPPMS